MDKLGRFVTAVKAIMQVAPEMPIQHLEVFLYIAEHDGTSNIEVARALGVQEQVCSRRVVYLTDRSYNKKAGVGLIKQSVNPLELRRKDLTLTAKGKRLRDTLIGVLQ